MGYNTSPEYETAQSRISTLIDEIGDQLSAINHAQDVDGVIAEQDKSNFISKQAELIVNYQAREEHDERDIYISKLQSELSQAYETIKAERGRWFKELQTNRHLKEALKQLTEVLTEN